MSHWTPVGSALPPLRAHAGGWQISGTLLGKVREWFTHSKGQGYVVKVRGVHLEIDAHSIARWHDEDGIEVDVIEWAPMPDEHEY